MNDKKKIGKFSENLGKKSVGSVPTTKTPRPEIQYPKETEKPKKSP